MHEDTAALFESIGGWGLIPEASFAIFGERGVIDILAWHAATRTLLVIELKTEIVDIQDLVGTVDRKRRLAAQIARERGWDPLVIATWVVVADSATNRRRVRAHERMLRAAFPDEALDVRRWLRAPRGAINALTFLSFATGGSRRPTPAPRKRVHAKRAERTVAYANESGRDAA
jgi:hypothetical protein